MKTEVRISIGIAIIIAAGIWGFRMAETHHAYYLVNRLSIMLAAALPFLFSPERVIHVWRTSRSTRIMVWVFASMFLIACISLGSILYIYRK